MLSFYYNLTVPLWESDNEWAHYSYVRHIVTNRQLPAPDTLVEVAPSGDTCQVIEENRVRNSQFRQPPLYYALGALAISWVDVDEELPWVANPHLFTQGARAGHNAAIHTAAESFPYSETTLAVHILRFFSGLIGLSGLVATYLTGLLVFSKQRTLALAMMAVNAFIPQYVFSSAVINNDILVGALGAWCVFFCVYAVLKDSSPLILMLAAAMAGLAVLAKYTALPLIPLVAVALLVRLRQARARGWQHAVTYAWQVGLMIGLAAIPLLLWFLRNKLLYDQIIVDYPPLAGFLADGQAWLVAGPDGGWLLDPVRAGEFSFMTFWGLFGNDTIALPPPILYLLAAVCLFALVGAIVTIFDKHQPMDRRILVLAAILFVLEAWLFSALKSVGTSEPRGRYLMSVFSTISFLLVLGTHRLLPNRIKKPGVAALCVALLVLTILVPPLLLKPLYATPVLEGSPGLRASEEPVYVKFGDFAELLGYQIDSDRLDVFEKLNVTLVWRALEETPNNYTVGLHLLDGANRSHGWLATYPGRGNFATSLWRPGDVFRDTYELYLEPSATEYLPSLGRVKISMFCYNALDPEEYDLLPVSAPGAKPIGDAVYVGRLRLADSMVDEPIAGRESLASFDESIDLESVSLSDETLVPGEDLLIDLVWRATGETGRDYTLFAHLVDLQGTQVAGNDQPLTDSYFPSGLWQAGDRVTHNHRVTLPRLLPAGPYEIRIGLYDPQSGVRLPVQEAEGEQLQNSELILRKYDVTTRYLFFPKVQVP
ncbi:MAG: glycosyltransferase family 39 protein [Chloroflexota bacterium]|nr:glycosyltransferase family 39 protein [Chloroflexota bacterium]